MNTSYTVTVSNSSGCLVQKSISISLKDDFLAAINGNINNIMTPNGDGKNDYLVFRNLEMYRNTTLKIFDKSGRELYAKVNYTNDWDGTYNGIPLAEDTYYYVIDFGPGKTRIKGYVSIVRRR